MKRVVFCVVDLANRCFISSFALNSPFALHMIGKASYEILSAVPYRNIYVHSRK